MVVLEDGLEPLRSVTWREVIVLEDATLGSSHGTLISSEGTVVVKEQANPFLLSPSGLTVLSLPLTCTPSRIPPAMM